MKVIGSFPTGKLAVYMCDSSFNGLYMRMPFNINISKSIFESKDYNS